MGGGLTRYTQQMAAEGLARRARVLRALGLRQAADGGVGSLHACLAPWQMHRVRASHAGLVLKTCRPASVGVSGLEQGSTNTTTSKQHDEVTTSRRVTAWRLGRCTVCTLTFEAP